MYPMIDWNAIDTVLLDMDGTLLDLRFDNHFWLHHLPRRYAEIHGHDADEARARLIARFEAEKGTLNWYCLEYWARELQVDIVALKHEVDHLIAERPFVREFLTGLKARGMRVILITNAHRDSLNLKMARADLTPWFDRTLSAHDFGHPKETQAFWHALHALEGFNPARTLFIDDTPSVLEAAHHYGIAHLLTLLQPDSGSPMRAREDLHYPGIHHFDELLPALHRTQE